MHDTIRAWISKVEIDLASARVLSSGLEVIPESAAYFCQQAAEKLVKAVLIACHIEPPRVHDIEILVEHLPPGIPLIVPLRALKRLTIYAVAYRYPGQFIDQPPLPSQEDLKAWVSEIQQIKAAVVATYLGPDPA